MPLQCWIFLVGQELNLREYYIILNYI